MLVKCPKCEKEVSTQGLRGHLRFAHGIRDEKKIEDIYEKGVEEEERKDLMTRISELHRRLQEVRMRKKELEKDDEGWLLEEDEAIEKLKRLCEKEERDISRELDELLKEVGEIDEEEEW